MKSVPIELALAVWLLSFAPDFIITALNNRLSGLISKDPVIVRVIATSFLCLLDIGIFGFPQSIFGPPLLTVALAFPAVGVGILYYFVEDGRLRLARRGAMRIAKQSFPIDSESSRRLGLLLLAAIAEELLFRWYILLVLQAYGLLPFFVCIFLSGLAFALSHQRLGTDVMVSRGLFGVVLTFPVLIWGNLFFAVIAHMAYNSLVHLRPVQYVQVKKEV